MPAVSQAQQEAAGIELASRRKGNPASRFKSMATSKLEEYASTPRKGLPKRSAANLKKINKRRQAVAKVRAGY